MAKENNLTITHPELCKEWDYEKNEKGPENYTHGSHAKVFWILNYYDKTKNKNFVFEWQSSIKDRCNGEGCPYLAPSPKVWVGFNDLATLRPDLISEWDFEKNEKGPECYTQYSNKKVFWKKEYYDQNTNKNFVFKWQSTISHRCTGANCPYLAPNPKVWKGFNDLATVRPDLISEWDFEKNENGPECYTQYSSMKVFWKKEYYDQLTNKTFVFKWSDTISHRTRENRGCPYLSGQAIYVGFNDLATTHFSIAKEWNYEKNNLTPQQVSAGSNKKVWFTCDKGHTYLASILNRTKSNGCPYCAASSSEKLVHNILDRNNIEFEIEKRFINKVKNSPYDIFMNNENLFIELDGEQHFKKINLYDKKCPFIKRVKIDNNKNKCAFENNVPLLRIPYKYFKEEIKMESLVLDFIRTRIIPKEIIDFYSQYDFSNYAELAEKYNETLKLKAS